MSAISRVYSFCHQLSLWVYSFFFIIIIYFDARFAVSLGALFMGYDINVCLRSVDN